MVHGRMEEPRLVHLVDEVDNWAAEAVRARLSSEGIAAVVRGRARLDASRVGPKPSVWVAPDDLEAARALVLESQVEEVFLDESDDDVGDADGEEDGFSPYDDRGRPLVGLVAILGLAALLFAVAFLVFSLVP